MGKRDRRRKSEQRKPTLPTSAQLAGEIKRTRRRRRRQHMVWSIVCAVLVIAAACVLAESIAFPVLRIYGDSMAPALAAGDVVVAVKDGEPAAGDVIGFHFHSSILVKRIVARSGDWVDMDENGNVYVNGELLDEPYLREKSFGTPDIDFPCQVPEGCVFVLGDHRSTSADSRSAAIGCVAEGNIIGKIVFRVWPLSRLGTLG